MATIKSGFTSFGRNRSGWSRLSSSRRLRRSSFSSSVSFGRPFPFHFGFKIGFPSSSRLGGSGSGSTHKPCFFSMYSDIGPFFGGRPRLGIVSSRSRFSKKPRIQSRDEYSKSRDVSLYRRYESRSERVSTRRGVHSPLLCFNNASPTPPTPTKTT